MQFVQKAVVKSIFPTLTSSLLLCFTFLASHVAHGMDVKASKVASDMPANCPAILNYKASPLLDDKAESLCKYSGKVVLIVNTASQCGFTPQYEGLEKVYRRYANQGFVVLGFPANDFGAQESGSNQEIAKFCKVNFGVSFPMYQKLKRPIASEPLFAELIRQTKEAPGWNFHKYLVSRDGKVKAFESGVEPDSKVLGQAIESALKSEAGKK